MKVSKLSKDTDDPQQQCLTHQENATIIANLLDVEDIEKRLARQVAGFQAMAVLIAAFIAYNLDGALHYALAVFSGGAVSVLNGALLAWRMSRSALHTNRESHHPGSAHQQLRNMYLYAAERFLVVMAMLGLCLVALKLSPLPVLSGFVIGQTVFLLARLFLNKLN